MIYPTDYADPYEAYPTDLDPSDFLKPCPFCGEDVSIRRNLRTGHTAIQCDYCRAWWTPAEHLTRNEITEAWNRRAKNENNMP